MDEADKQNADSRFVSPVLQTKRDTRNNPDAAHLSADFRAYKR